MDDLVGKHALRLELPADAVNDQTGFESIAQLGTALTECRRCPRLVTWREEVARDKRAAFLDQEYWGRPVTGFGDPAASIAVVGLAPAAHGANRTGRMFTGDRSGEWLYRAMYRAGLANQPDAVSVDDGLRLTDVWVTSAVKCAPPANKPTTRERDTCSEWLHTELTLLSNASVFVCLGQFGYLAVWRYLAATGVTLPKPRPKFAHALDVKVDGLRVLASFHPSQQNTFTGKLTEQMLDQIFVAARQASIGS